MADQQQELPSAAELIAKATPIETDTFNSTCGRITGQFAVFYEKCDEPHINIGGHYSILIESDEQAVNRKRLVVGKHWVEIPAGWAEFPLSETRIVVAENTAGVHRTTNPTKEEKEAAALQYVLVGLQTKKGVEAISYCRPRQPFINECVDASRLRFCAPEAGTDVKIFITLLPK